MRKGLPTLIAALLALALPAGAQSAVTIGSLPPSTTTGGCSLCFGIQAQDSGPNLYTAPISGVVTSFAMRSGTVLTATDKFRLMVVEAAVPPNWTLAGASDFVFWPGTGATYQDKPISWTARVPILAGAHIGIDFRTDAGGNSLYYYATGNAADKLFLVGGSPLEIGQTSTSGLTPSSERLNLTATIEPDADHDGYGDETQDGCPTDRSDHGPCTKPVLTGFKFSLDKFRVDTKGSVLSASATAGKGTTIIETLSKPAHVSFVMNLKATGRKVGGKCRKKTRSNAGRKKCRYYSRQFHFNRDLPAGTSNIGFSGRIKVGTKTRALPPGSYVATAYPFSVQSQLGGDIAKTTFRVVPAAKRR